MQDKYTVPGILPRILAGATYSAAGMWCFETKQNNGGGGIIGGGMIGGGMIE
jgi:hypothetical protein